MCRFERLFAVLHRYDALSYFVSLIIFAFAFVFVFDPDSRLHTPSDFHLIFGFPLDTTTRSLPSSLICIISLVFVCSLLPSFRPKDHRILYTYSCSHQYILCGI
ncbi:hypothetical protein BJ912DRAFT_80278 [Pholiota molesta]|nr:hypothetical protein BJ912DRAFT_80278 [Pholiota molesta]